MTLVNFLQGIFAKKFKHIKNPSYIKLRKNCQNKMIYNYSSRVKLAYNLTSPHEHINGHESDAALRKSNNTRNINLIIKIQHVRYDFLLLFKRKDIV